MSKIEKVHTGSNTKKQREIIESGNIEKQSKEEKKDGKELFRIGEVAKMYHISMGTLRHYEQAGLLKPEYIDAQTGYRYYGVRQLEVMNTIRYLRVLDIPLPQIAEFLQNRDIPVIQEKLKKQKALIQQKQKELELIEQKIDHRLKQLQDAVESELDQISVREIPAGRIVWIRDSLKLNSYLDLEYSIQKLQKNQKEPLAFLGKVGVGISKENLEQGNFQNYERVFLMLDEEDQYEGEIESLPVEQCVTVRFCGSHVEAAEQYEKLMQYIRRNDYQIVGFSREITLVDYGITNDPEKFVTEIRIPISKI